MNFRKDINGLRALAVFPVLFFHAEWKLFSGGFLGVDVFFVISGFLISSLIIRDLESGSFSIISFYDRRARRILPALLLLCLVTTILSFVFMLPYDLKNYGQSLVATILSANNILLYLTSGYWSLASEFKPLYHTWSLGVEEQFYMILPILFMLSYWVAKNKTRALLVVSVVLFLISYVISLSSENREFNFLIISHRMWELLSGTFVAIYLSRTSVKSNNLIVFAGLLLIVFSYMYPFAVTSNQALYSLFPVIGTVLIIIYSSNILMIGKLLSSRPLLLMGAISYSIYLYHMPILAFLRLSIDGKPSVPTQLVFVLMAVPLAYCSWRFVENVFRDRNIVPNKYFYSIHLVLALLLLCGGGVLHKTYGLQKYSAQFSYGVNPQKYADGPFAYTKKEFAQPDKKNLLIIGSSFARDFANMMLEQNVSTSYEFIYIFDIDADIELTKKLIASADLVIGVSAAGMAATLGDSEKLIKGSKRWLSLFREYSKGQYLLVGTKNFGWNNNFVLRKSTSDLVNYRVQVNSTTLEANQIEKNIWGENYVDVIEAISHDGLTVPLFTPNGDFISFDTEHATKYGAIYLGEILLNNTVLKEKLGL